MGIGYDHLISEGGASKYMKKKVSHLIRLYCYCGNIPINFNIRNVKVNFLPILKI